jgi:tetratricopeptide (TPR) repeat protein
VTLGPMEYWVARALGTADPNQPRVIESTPIGLGTALSDRRQADSEIEEFRVALQLRPDDAASHYNRGRAWVAKGQMDAAIAEFRKALKLRPDDVPSHVGLGIRVLGARAHHGRPAGGAIGVVLGHS